MSKVKGWVVSSSSESFATYIHQATKNNRKYHPTALEAPFKTATFIAERSPHHPWHILTPLRWFNTFFPQGRGTCIRQHEKWLRSVKLLGSLSIQSLNAPGARGQRRAFFHTLRLKRLGRWELGTWCWNGWWLVITIQLIQLVCLGIR